MKSLLAHSVLALALGATGAACGNTPCEPKSDADLEALAAEGSIGCYLKIRETALDDLDALAGLVEARGGVSISANEQLTDISGLNDVSIKGSLTIWDNSTLTDARFEARGEIFELGFRGSGIESIDVTVLGAVQQVTLSNAPKLVAFSLGGLQEVDALDVYDAVLSDLDGLADIKRVTRFLAFRRVEGLTHAAVDAFVAQLEELPSEIVACDLDDGDACD